MANGTWLSNTVLVRLVSNDYSFIGRSTLKILKYYTLIRKSPTYFVRTKPTQQIEIQLSVIHNYASQYLGLVIGSEKPTAKS